MTIKIDQIADAVISAPGARAVVTQAASGTINSGTWTELLSQNIIPTFAGLYRVDLSFTTYASSGSSNSRFDFKLVFDEGGADEVTVSGNAWYWRQDDFFRYKQHNYHEFVELVAKSQTVKAYGRRDSGDFVLNVAGNQYTQVTIQSLVGSGAGGTLSETASLVGNSDTITSVSPTFETIKQSSVEQLAININVSGPNDEIIFLANGFCRPDASVTNSNLQIKLVDGDDTPVDPGSTIFLTGDTSADYVNWTINAIKSGLTGGSYTFRIKAAVDSAGHNWVFNSGRLTALIFRGGLVPIQQDGVDVVGQPRALNFIGAGVYEVTEGYGENAGVANIELNSAITGTPKGTWATTTTVDFAARPGQPSTTRLTLQDGKQRTMTTGTFDVANGVADWGYDEAASQGNDRWLWFYAVPKSGDDNSLVVRASDNSPSTGPTGYSNFKVVWVTYMGTGALLKVIQRGNEFRFVARRNMIVQSNIAAFAWTSYDLALAATGDTGPYCPSTASKVLLTSRMWHNTTAVDRWDFEISYDGSSLIWSSTVEDTASGNTTSHMDRMYEPIVDPANNARLYVRLIHNYGSSANLGYLGVSVLGWTDEWIDP